MPIVGNSNTQLQKISFRTMEDASAVDLDWFFRGWFYTTDYNDIGNQKKLKKYYVIEYEPSKEVTKSFLAQKKKEEDQAN